MMGRPKFHTILSILLLLQCSVQHGQSFLGTALGEEEGGGAVNVLSCWWESEGCKYFLGNGRKDICMVICCTTECGDTRVVLAKSAGYRDLYVVLTADNPTASSKWIAGFQLSRIHHW